jgi:hypothetical protein
VINVAELSQGFIAMLQAALAGKLPSDSSDRYYFVENREYEQRQITETSRVLHVKGEVDEATPTQVRLAHAEKYAVAEWFDLRWTGGTARSRAVKLRQLGWVPKDGGLTELLFSIEVDHFLN